jgi:hypothetical protein
MSITPEECQCMAARSSLLGDLMESQSKSKSGSRDKAEALEGEALAYQAIDERNKSAGVALGLYYLLAEAESGRDLLDESLVEIGQALEDLRDVQDSGLPLDVDSGVLERQRRALLDEQTVLDLLIRRLNGQLRRLLDLKCDRDVRIWPDADFTAPADPVDAEVAVCTALDQRADLAMLRLVERRLDRDTVMAVGRALGAVHPSLAGPAGVKRILLRRRAEKEVQSRRRQIRQLRAQRESEVAEETRQAVRSVNTRINQVVLAAETLASWEDTIEELKDRNETDDEITPFDITTAKLSKVQSQVNLMHQVAAYRMAEVQLRQAQGLLAVECGYTLPPCAKPCAK